MAGQQTSLALNGFSALISIQSIVQLEYIALLSMATRVISQLNSNSQENNIITLCMPPYSSHLLQPLDVSCFGPLKKAYGRQVENLVRSYINHITKLELLPAFKAAFEAAITEQNIRAGFQGSGLVPFSPNNVLTP